MPTLIEQFLTGDGFTESLASLIADGQTHTIQSAINACPPEKLSDLQYLVSTASTCVIIPGSEPPAFFRLVTIPILVHDADSLPGGLDSDTVNRLARLFRSTGLLAAESDTTVLLPFFYCFADLPPLLERRRATLDFIDNLRNRSFPSPTVLPLDLLSVRFLFGAVIHEGNDPFLIDTDQSLMFRRKRFSTEASTLIGKAITAREVTALPVFDLHLGPYSAYLSLVEWQAKTGMPIEPFPDHLFALDTLIE